MKPSDFLMPALGAGIVYAAHTVKAIPDWARGPLTVIGTLMAVKPLAPVQNVI